MLGTVVDRASFFEQKQTTFTTRQIAQKLNRRRDNEYQSDRDKRRCEIKPHTP